jgi:hypothetical protein
VRILYRHTQRATTIIVGLLLIAPVIVIVLVLTLQEPIKWRALLVVSTVVLTLLAGTG